jgi:hypothetical protein
MFFQGSTLKKRKPRRKKQRKHNTDSLLHDMSHQHKVQEPSDTICLLDK